MDRLFLVPLLMLAALAIAACSTDPAANLATAGYTLETYCALNPAVRAEIRRKLDIKVQVLCADAPQTGVPQPTAAVPTPPA